MAKPQAEGLLREKLLSMAKFWLQKSRKAVPNGYGTELELHRQHHLHKIQGLSIFGIQDELRIQLTQLHDRLAHL